jgi:DNA mismatch endonuclease (patch repair protein)
MRANRKINTTPEMRLRSALHARGLRFRKHQRIVLEGIATRPDIVFSRWRVAVFVDGCFWHGCPAHFTQPRANAAYWGPKIDRNKRRDEAQTAALKAAGWRVLRVWEHVPTEDAVALVRDALAQAERAADDGVAASRRSARRHS